MKQLENASYTFIVILKKLVRKDFLLRLIGVYDTVVDLCQLCDQLMDALRLLRDKDKVEPMMLDTDPAEAYPCQSYLKSEPAEWVRLNNVDLTYLKNDPIVTYGAGMKFTMRPWDMGMTIEIEPEVKE